MQDASARKRSRRIGESRFLIDGDVLCLAKIDVRRVCDEILRVRQIAEAAQVEDLHAMPGRAGDYEGVIRIDFYSTFSGIAGPRGQLAQVHRIFRI